MDERRRAQEIWPKTIYYRLFHAIFMWTAERWLQILEPIVFLINFIYIFFDARRWYANLFCFAGGLSARGRTVSANERKCRFEFILASVEKILCVERTISTHISMWWQRVRTAFTWNWFVRPTFWHACWNNDCDAILFSFVVRCIGTKWGVIEDVSSSCSRSCSLFAAHMRCYPSKLRLIWCQLVTD